MKSFFYLLLFFIVLLFGITFVIKNPPQTVELNYYFGWTWSGSLSLLLVAVLALGTIMGVLFTLGWVYRAKRQTARLRRELEQAEYEAANLRAISTQEST